MPPTAEDRYTSGTYLAANPEWHAGESEWKAAAIVRILRKHVLSPRAIVDVGCGVGVVLKFLRAELPPAALEGYDISPVAIDLARSQNANGIHFSVGMPPPDRHYDLQLVLDVAEHVEDAAAWLRERRHAAEYTIFHLPLDLTVHRVLRPRALVNIRNRYGHLHFFNRELALAALGVAGFEVLDWAYTEEFRVGRAGTFSSALLRPLRSLLYLISPDLSVCLVGGCRLLVLTRPGGRPEGA